MNPKPWIEGLSECGVECVQVGQCVRGDSVEGQSAGWPVQIHSYSVGAGGGDVYGSVLIIVPGRVTVVRADQTPGLVIVSKPTVITPSSPADSFICHSYISPSLHSTLPPSNSAQSDPLYTAPVHSPQISLGDKDTAAPLSSMSPFCSPQTERGICLLCLGSV
ncbi:hypothetical protein J4Q44_G00381680 [Coregonus suidteri]|uniref:Uncharacterized protein n=1 Tax=Coregonus suidteri TaxID=861788 RepID=A0AAN8KHA5_9TELE